MAQVQIDFVTKRPDKFLDALEDRNFESTWLNAALRYCAIRRNMASLPPSGTDKLTIEPELIPADIVELDRSNKP